MSLNETPSSSGFQVRTTRREPQQPALSTDAEHSSTPPRTRRTGRDRSESDKLEAVRDLVRGKPRADEDEDASPNGGVGQPTSRSLLDRLGAGDDPGEGDASPNAGEGRNDPAQQRQDLDLSDIKSLAKALGTSPKALYDKLTFQVGESQMTLGQLKDTVQDQQTAVSETTKREAALIARESALVRDQQMLAAVMGDLQGKLRPETVKALEDKRKAREAREFQLMRQTMPELSDPKVFADWRNDVVGMLNEYGFQPHEVQVHDHRMLLALRDMLRFKKLLAKVANLETERTRKDPPANVRSRKQARPNRQASQNEAMQRARRGSETDKVKAIAGLIGSNQVP